MAPRGARVVAERMLRALVVVLLASLLPACPPAEPPAKKKDRPDKVDPPKAARRDAADDDDESAGVTERRDPSAGFVPTPPAPELVFSREQQAALLAVARAGCDGTAIDAAKKAAPAQLAGQKTGVLAVLYDEGGKRVRSRRVGDAADVVAAAYAAGQAVCRDASDRRGLLHLLVITRQAHVLNFGIKGLFDNKVFEPQVTGVIYHLDDKSFELDPLTQIEKNMGPSDSRTALAKGVGVEPSVAPNRIDITVELYRGEHVGEAFPDKKTTHYFRGHERLTHEQVTHALIEERLKLIAGWYKNNVKDGEVVYQYATSRKAFEDDDRTMVRSTITTMVLNRLAVYFNDAALADKGREVLEHYFERYFQMKKSREAGRLLPSTVPLKNGNTVQQRWTSASFIAAAALERADRDRYQTEMDLLMDWAQTYQRKDGVIWSPSGAEQYFMPGQYLLAVSYFYRKTKDEKYKAIFDKAWAVYAPTLQNTMRLGPAWHIPYAPAWFTMPFTQMWLETGDDRYKELIFEINDRVILAYETNARQQIYYDYDGMLAPKPLSYGNNSVTAASLESLADAATVAKKSGDKERYRRYQEVIRRTVAFLLRLQWTPQNTYYVQDRQQVMGGFKNDMVNTKSWMDSVWHLTSAFMKIQQQQLLES